MVAATRSSSSGRREEGTAANQEPGNLVLRRDRRTAARPFGHTSLIFDCRFVVIHGGEMPTHPTLAAFTTMFTR